MTEIKITTDKPVSEAKLRFMELIARCQNEEQIDALRRTLELQQALDGAAKASA